MTNKLTLLIKLSLLLFALLVLNGCEMEQDYLETNNTELTVRKITYEDFKARRNVFEKFKVAAKSTSPSETSRVIYDEEYGVYYDTNNIIFIEKDDYRSYTIPLIPQEDELAVKNLVLYQKDNEPVKVKMMNYALTENEIDRIRNGEYVDVTNKTTSQSYVNATNSSTSWYDDSGCLVTATITYTPGTMCVNNIHSFGETCLCQGGDRPTPPRIVIKYTYAFCSSGNTGGGPGVGTGTGSGPGGPGGSGTPPETGSGPNTPVDDEADDEVLTTPVVPGLTRPEETPCDDLKLMSNPAKSNLKSKVDELKPYSIVANSSTEYGCEIKRTMNSDESFSYVAAPIKELGKNGGKLELNPMIAATLHNHTVKGHSIPSYSDLRTLLNTYNIASNGRKAYATIFIVAQDKVSGQINTYAIKIDDIQLFADQMDNVWRSPQYANYPNEELKLKAIDKKDSERYDKQPTQLEKAFLLQYYSFGISLYKTDDENLNNWKKLELTSQGIVDPIPCNN